MEAATSSSKIESESSQEESSTPSEEVSPEEVSLPQVVSNTPETPKNDNFIVGLIAWVFVLIGVAVVVIVLFSSKGKGENVVYNKKRYTNKKKNKRLLQDKYYRNYKKR